MQTLHKQEDTLAELRSRLSHPPPELLPRDEARAQLYVMWKRALAEKEELLRQARRRKHELMKDLKVRAAAARHAPASSQRALVGCVVWPHAGRSCVSWLTRRHALLLRRAGGRCVSGAARVAGGAAGAGAAGSRGGTEGDSACRTRARGAAPGRASGGGGEHQTLRPGYGNVRRKRAILPTPPPPPPRRSRRPRRPTGSERSSSSSGLPCSWIAWPRTCRWRVCWPSGSS